MLISCCINCDTRQGYLNDSSEWTLKPLGGVRNIDFLLAGVKSKMEFFRGHDTQCIVYVDKHEPIAEDLFFQIDGLVKSYGNNSKLVISEHDRGRYRWSDYLYLEALKLADGDFVAHFDADANAFRSNENNIIDKYLEWLRGDYKYVCQPLAANVERPYYASTRFFICKRETLDLDLIEKSFFIQPLNGKHNVCLEHTLGALAGDGKVLYPDREDDSYMIFSWSKYFKGTLAKLNSMPYNELKEHILKLGLYGVHDIEDKQ